MQYQALAVLALSAGALAAPEKRQADASYNTVSVLSVLETALPSSVLEGALTNSASVYSQIASEFAAGTTPSWFTGLPSDIQTLFVPAATASATAGSFTNATSAASSAASSAIVIGGVNGTAVSGNGTTVSPTGNSTLSGNSTRSASTRLTTSTSSSGSSGSSSGSSGSGSGSSGSGSSGSTSSSSGGASLPTAIYGMSLAGAVGLVGVLAL